MMIVFNSSLCILGSAHFPSSCCEARKSVWKDQEQASQVQEAGQY